MNREWKIIVPRVVGDETLFNQAMIHGVNGLGFLVRVFSCGDEPNNPEINTIHHKHHRGMEVLKNSELKDDDIVIFSHNDVNFIDSCFRDKVETIFSKTDVALLGVIGTSELKESGCWWDNPTNILRGHIIQGARDKAVGDGFHLVKGQIGFFDDVVAVDGLCMITLGKYFKLGGIEIDNTTYSGNHFYDLDMCMNYLSKGYKIGIADILVYHKSEGESNDNEKWTTEKDKFISKWKSKGIEFPVTAESMKLWREKNNIITPDVNKKPQIIEIEI